MESLPPYHLQNYRYLTPSISTPQSATLPENVSFLPSNDLTELGVPTSPEYASLLPSKHLTKSAVHYKQKLTPRQKTQPPTTKMMVTKMKKKIKAKVSTVPKKQKSGICQASTSSYPTPSNGRRDLETEISREGPDRDWDIFAI